MSTTDIKPNYQSVDLAIKRLNLIKSRITNGENIQVDTVTLDIKVRPAKPVAKKLLFHPLAI